MDDIIIITANQVKNLLAQCAERGLPAKFTRTDVDEIVREYREPSNGIPDSARARRQILHLLRAVHELLYTSSHHG